MGPSRQTTKLEGVSEASRGGGTYQSHFFHRSWRLPLGLSSPGTKIACGLWIHRVKDPVPINAMQISELELCYKPLQKDQIRLFSLLPGRRCDPIRGCLKIRNLNLDECGGDYEALSYCWGDVRRHQRLIEVDGMAFPVGQNLQGALQSLRHIDRPRLMWIDGICINQCDAKEKNEQVRMMLEIYGAAKGVVAWLGPSTQHTSVGMSLLADIKNGRREGEEPSWTALPTQLVEDGLMDIAGRQYFTRLWVVQETAIAKRVVLTCGQYSIAWNNGIKEVSCFLRFLKAASISPEWRVSDMEVDLSPLINLLQMQLDTGPHYELWEEKRPLPDLLEIAYDTRHRETTDVRDQLYALVALLYRRRPSLVSEFKSDYSMSVQETFEQLEKSLQDSELSHVYKVSGSSQRSLGQTADEKQVANAQSMRDDFQPEIEEVHWARPEVGESGNFSAKQELVSQSQKAVVTGHGASALDHHEALDKAKEFLAGNHLAEAAEQLEQLAGSLKKIAGQRGVVRG